MKETLIHLYQYLKNPDHKISENKTIRNKIKWLSLLLIIDIPLTFIAGFFPRILIKFGLINSKWDFISDLIQKVHPLFIIVVLVIFIPFFEELIFRLPLRFKRINFIPFLILGILLTGISILYSLHLPYYLFISIPILISGILAYFIFNKNFFDKTQNIWLDKFKFVFYSVASLFALIHLTNFDYSIYLLLFAPLIVLPQFIAGIFMGFLRIRFGFIWGFWLHALHNAIFILPFLLFPAINHPKLIEKIDKEDYTFEVYEGKSFSKIESLKSSTTASMSKVTPNEIILNGKFKDVVSTLTIINKRNIRFKNNFLGEKEISLYFRNDSAKIKSARIASLLVFENLLKSYNLETKNEKRDLTVWNLSVKNEYLFATHFSDSADSISKSNIRGFFGTRDTLKLNDINSEFLSKTLRIAFDTEIQNDIDKNTLFSVKIPNNDFNNLKKFLESNYGLTIEKKTEKRDMMVIF